MKEVIIVDRSKFDEMLKRERYEGISEQLKRRICRKKGNDVQVLNDMLWDAGLDNVDALMVDLIDISGVLNNPAEVEAIKEKEKSHE